MTTSPSPWSEYDAWGQGRAVWVELCVVACPNGILLTGWIYSICSVYAITIWTMQISWTLLVAFKLITIIAKPMASRICVYTECTSRLSYCSVSDCRHLAQSTVRALECMVLETFPHCIPKWEVHQSAIERPIGEARHHLVEQKWSGVYNTILRKVLSDIQGFTITVFQCQRKRVVMRWLISDLTQLEIEC